MWVGLVETATYCPTILILLRSWPTVSSQYALVDP